MGSQWVSKEVSGTFFRNNPWGRIPWVLTGLQGPLRFPWVSRTFDKTDMQQRASGWTRILGCCSKDTSAHGTHALPTVLQCQVLFMLCPEHTYNRCYSEHNPFTPHTSFCVQMVHHLTKKKKLELVLIIISGWNMSIYLVFWYSSLL